MKRLRVTFIAAIICLGTMITAFAAETNDSLKDTAARFLEAHYGHTVNLDNGIDLLGNLQNVIARCYQVDEGGYIIISTEDQQVIEFSITENNTFFTDADKVYYYGGPLTYLEDVDGRLIDIHYRKELGAVDEIASLLSLETSDQAVAMYFMCLDKNFNDAYVPASLEPTTADGRLLIEHFIPWIDSSGTGSYVGDVLNGMNKFLAENNMKSKNVTSVNGADGLLSYIVGRVSNNYPYILDIKGHPTYKNHWVTGYGYSDNFAVVNDGWGRNGIYINLSYGASLVYIENV